MHHRQCRRRRRVSRRGWPLPPPQTETPARPGRTPAASSTSGSRARSAACAGPSLRAERLCACVRACVCVCVCGCVCMRENERDRERERARARERRAVAAVQLYPSRVSAYPRCCLRRCRCIRRLPRRSPRSHARRAAPRGRGESPSPCPSRHRDSRLSLAHALHDGSCGRNRNHAKFKARKRQSIREDRQPKSNKTFDSSGKESFGTKI